MVKHLMASTAGLSSLARPQPKKKVEDEKLKTSAQPMAADDDKDDDDDKDKEDKGKAKKAKKAEGDDEDDDEDDDDKSKAHNSASSTDQFLAGAANERAKMRAVLASEAGSAAFKANPDKVMRFLTSYSGTKEDAIATLELLGPTEAAPAARTESPLRERMAESKVPVAGPDATGETSEASSVVNLILAADKMRRGEK